MSWTCPNPAGIVYSNATNAPHPTFRTPPGTASRRAKAESRWPRRLATVLSIVLVVPLAYAMPAYAEPRSAPAVQKETPVKGEKVPVLPPMADPRAETGVEGATGSHLAQTAEGRAGRRRGQDPGGRLPGEAGRREGPAAKAAQAAAGPVKVELLDTRRGSAWPCGSPPARAVAAARARRGQAGRRPQLEIDYSGFRYAYGGDYGARLRLVKLAECALDAARRPAAPAPEPVQERERHRDRHADRRGRDDRRRCTR